MTDGLPPPNDVEAEEQLIGNLLTRPDQLYRMPVVLTPEAFYDRELGEMFAGVNALVLDSSTRPSAGALRNWMRANNRDVDLARVLDLPDTVPSVSNKQLHEAAERVFWLGKQREMLHRIHRLMARGYNMGEAGREWLKDVEEQVYGALLFEERELSIAEELEVIERHMQNGMNDEEIPTTIGGLNRKMGGWSSLSVVGARPAVGKTAFALEQMTLVAERGDGALGFSLEMSRNKWVKRMVTQQTGISVRQMNAGDVGPEGWKRYAEAKRKISSLPIEIYDRPGPTVADVRARVRMTKARMKALHNVNLRLVVVDYLQLMTGPQQSREERVAEISKGLLSIHKEFNVIVLALSQLNRKTAMDNKRPTLADLRESGQIEQDATCVVLMHDTDPTLEKQQKPRELIIAKARDAEGGIVNAMLDGPSLSFFETDPDTPPRYDDGFQDGM